MIFVQAFFPRFASGWSKQDKSIPNTALHRSDTHATSDDTVDRFTIYTSVRLKNKRSP